MSGFTLHLQSAARHETFENVASFVGMDATGGFGVLPGRERFMTILEYGLSRFRQGEGPWQYVACPGGVLRFAHGELVVNTRRYLRGDGYEAVSATLAGQLAGEEAELKTVKDSLQKLERELYRRLRELDGWKR